MVDVNLLAHVWAAQRCYPAMVDEGAGYLVQTISSAALITGPSPMGYTLTKHGALGFAEWVALNYVHLGITVTCLCPNAVNTGMLGRNEDDERRAGRPATGRRQHRRRGRTRAVADMALDAMAQRRFLVLPHPRVGRVVPAQGERLRPLARRHEPAIAADARRGRLTGRARWSGAGSDARSRAANSAA